jgi:cytochrome c-type biogenesis protein CcmE
MLNKQRRQRLYYLLLLMLGIGLAVGLILYSLKQNINLFLTPTQALSTELPAKHHFRLGGQVKMGSIQRDKKNLTVHFILTDLKHEIPISYTGILPDLFREGNGAIAEGYWKPETTQQKEFIATEILAKHDENYMPRAVYDALRKDAKARP